MCECLHCVTVSVMSASRNAKSPNIGYVLKWIPAFAYEKLNDQEDRFKE